MSPLVARNAPVVFLFQPTAFAFFPPPNFSSSPVAPFLFFRWPSARLASAYWNRERVNPLSELDRRPLSSLDNLLFPLSAFMPLPPVRIFPSHSFFSEIGTDSPPPGAGMGPSFLNEFFHRPRLVLFPPNAIIPFLGVPPLFFTLRV